MRRIVFAVAAATLLASGTAHACPDCETALLTRRRVAMEGFSERLGVAVLPFAASVGLALVLARALDRRTC